MRLARNQTGKRGQFMETRYQRVAREQSERKQERLTREKALSRARKPRRSYSAIADRIDGYERDDMGESPDF
jgi:hypothetical protein